MPDNSHEEEAPSAAWEDEVPQDVKELRRQEIMELQADISRRRLERYVGTRLPVLLEGVLSEDRGTRVGRTPYQAPEVDGVVLITVRGGQSPSEAIQEVEILRSDVYDLYGTLT